MNWRVVIAGVLSTAAMIGLFLVMKFAVYGISYDFGVGFGVGCTLGVFIGLIGAHFEAKNREAVRR